MGIFQAYFFTKSWCCKSASVFFDLANYRVGQCLISPGFAKDLNDERFELGDYGRGRVAGKTGNRFASRPRARLARKISASVRKRRFVAIAPLAFQPPAAVLSGDQQYSRIGVIGGQVEDAGIAAGVVAAREGE